MHCLFMYNICMWVCKKLYSFYKYTQLISNSKSQFIFFICSLNIALYSWKMKTVIVKRYIKSNSTSYFTCVQYMQFIKKIFSVSKCDYIIIFFKSWIYKYV